MSKRLWPDPESEPLIINIGRSDLDLSRVCPMIYLTLLDKRALVTVGILPNILPSHIPGDMVEPFSVEFGENQSLLYRQIPESWTISLGVALDNSLEIERALRAKIAKNCLLNVFTEDNGYFVRFEIIPHPEGKNFYSSSIRLPLDEFLHFLEQVKAQDLLGSSKIFV